jgi:hypothetical protein
MSIRTTLTLDEDVFERVKAESTVRGLPFRQVVNDLLRTGLLVSRQPRPVEPFKVVPESMGLIEGLNYDDIEGLLEFGEGPAHR